MRYLVFLIILVVQLSSCRNENKVVNSFEKGNEEPKFYDLDTLELTEFTEILRDKRSNSNHATFSGDFKKAFINSENVKTLIPLIHSKERCKCSLNILSSKMDNSDYAEIGGVAISFIEDFRNNKNPKLELWNCPKTDDKKATEIEVWWKNRKE